ncbi:MAG TPA: L,D-transpeptidase [Anaerolineales bacterium]|nr:L,D-transpeptidase [Anaerolineales bacterium]
MTSSKTADRDRGSSAFWSIALIAILMVTLISGATLAMSPGLVSRPQPSPSAAGKPVSWAAVDIAKPTYTPSPVPTETSTPLPPPTDAPAPASTATPPLLVMTYPDMQSAPLGAQSVQPASLSSPGGKYIYVSISDQHLTAYQNGQLVFSFVASTGMQHSTRIGSFSVLDKIPNAYGATWNIWMPDWLGIYYSGSLENGIHALPILPNGNTLWAGFLGTPISFGCVVLGSQEALQLYNWVDIGTPVDISW